MKVRMSVNANAAGVSGVWAAGTVVDVSPEDAKALVAGRYAEYVGDAKMVLEDDRGGQPPEKAVKREKAEKAVRED